MPHSGYLQVDKDQLGTLLADASDMGIGLVIANFANLKSYNQCLMGRFCKENYNPLTYEDFWKSGVKLQLGAVPEPYHPILNCVKTFDGGSYSGYVECKVQAHAKLIAQWSNEVPLIAECVNPHNRLSVIVALNCCTVSSAHLASCWNRTTGTKQFLFFCFVNINLF